MDFVPQGGLWTGLVRGAWELDGFFHRSSMPPWLRQQAIKTANRLAKAPLNARDRLVSNLRRRRWQNRPRVGPAELLAGVGRAPQWLLGDFVEGVKVDPRARGYFLDPSRRVTHAYFLGLDLMHTPQGICCLEANLAAGIVRKREQVLPENYIVKRVLEAARDHGVKRVVWVEGRTVRLPDWMLSDLQELPREAGIELELLEDPTAPIRSTLPPGVPRPSRWALPQWVPSETLVIRRNSFPVGSDYVVSHKGAFVRSLEKALRRRNETRVHVLPMTRVPTEVPEPQGPGLPNLVYKYPDSFQGRGVHFIKARDTEHALALARELDQRYREPPGLFQPYRVSVLPDGRYIFGFRFEILVSPQGSWYLASFLRAGVGDIPEEVPWGIVPSIGVFVADPSRGSDFEVVGPEMEKKLSAAALAVGDALRDALEETFQTRPSRA
jgi:hypothetical protein